MIHSLLVVVLTFSAAADEAPPTTASSPDTALAASQDPVPPEQTAPPLRTGAELRKVIRDSMRQWARVDDDRADEAARRLLALYTELRADAEMSRVQRENYRVKLRGRLLSLGKQITKRIAREERLAKRDGVKPDQLNARAKPAPLAQVAPGFGGPGFRGGGFRGGAGGPAMGGFGGRPMGGGGAAFGQLGAGGFGAPGAQANDNGQQLVNLIQATIAPQSWDVNGGPGAIRYWRPGQALIIRQTEERHEEVLDLLLQLRRAGG